MYQHRALWLAYFSKFNASGDNGRIPVNIIKYGFFRSTGHYKSGHVLTFSRKW